MRHVDLPVSEPRVKLLIVGAGPTGLALANVLAAHGIQFDIVDRKSAPSEASKALAINVATQYGFELIGLGDSIGRLGARLQRINLLWQGKRFSAVDLRHLDFHLRSVITQPQQQTEAELIAALLRRGVRVGFQTELTEMWWAAKASRV
jgi:2-polyprenyl-6-methoxyphenol hydroxylase-like FAD-dependent oxidoreductase